MKGLDRLLGGGAERRKGRRGGLRYWGMFQLRCIWRTPGRLRASKLTRSRRAGP